MVIGNGMIAKAFDAYVSNGDVVIFAAGVSNSKEARVEQFRREEDIVVATLSETRGRLFVCFSTCSIYDDDVSSSPYVRHKINIEDIIRKSGNDFIIFRVSNIVGPSTNKFTIINHLFDKIVKRESFELWKNSYRNIIDIQDVYKTVDYILRNNKFRNQTVNIASPVNTRVIDVVKIIEDITGSKAVFREVERGSSYHIDVTMITDIFGDIGIAFDGEYARRTIKKYFIQNERTHEPVGSDPGI
ncbi:MAG: NAD-dependent epimerase/dehydratase family protein [Nitrospirae bacterium]|nr:NAD-dependent epimerase/dehydratase family protein [Nitrospirota bacterium]